jgi:hypothetical protein
MARRGSLHRVMRGVYAAGHRSLERDALLRAAVLACGEGAVLSHATAAAHWGLQRQRPVLVDVTVPVEAGRKLDGIRCRRCRYPDPTEICVHRGVLCTTPARVLVDLAGMLGRDSLRGRVEQAAVLKLLDIGAIDLSLDLAKGRRGLRTLSAIIEPWRTESGRTPDVRSGFEARVLPRLLARGLPRPVCNRPLRIEGEIVIPDFLWPEHRFVVECDGRGTHETPIAFQRDRRRDQLLLGEGFRVARITWEQIRSTRSSRASPELSTRSPIARFLSALCGHKGTTERGAAVGAQAGGLPRLR